MDYGFTPDGFSMTNVSLSTLVMFALRVRSPKFISGLPSWTESTRFDIHAKLDEDKASTLKGLPMPEAAEDRSIMLQRMLFERFALKIHHVQKEFPAYALIVARKGPHLKEPSKDSGPSSSNVREGELFLKASTTSVLAHSLSHYLDREVLDQTGLTGRYDISLKWASQAAALEQPDGAPVDFRASIFTAVREQLGLRLVPAHSTSADTIVVDSIEMPTEN